MPQKTIAQPNIQFREILSLLFGTDGNDHPEDNPLSPEFHWDEHTERAFQHYQRLHYPNHRSDHCPHKRGLSGSL